MEYLTGDVILNGFPNSKITLRKTQRCNISSIVDQYQHVSLHSFFFPRLLKSMLVIFNFLSLDGILHVKMKNL